MGHSHRIARCNAFRGRMAFFSSKGVPVFQNSCSVPVHCIVSTNFIQLHPLIAPRKVVMMAQCREKGEIHILSTAWRPTTALDRIAP
jgi:hypothetical protein